MPDLPGICPPNIRCKISHAQPPYINKVGVYPSDFLPAKRTTWYAPFAVRFPLAPPLTEGPTTFGTFGGGLLGGFDQFIPNLGAVHTFQSFHTIIFARTANRVNIAHVITQEEINSMGQDGRQPSVGLINLGEYIFECVCVLDDKQDILASAELTQSELDEIIRSEENESDRKFRKLFEIKIPNNRFLSIPYNKLGVEYRLDNATDKENLALDSAGRSDLTNPSYRDASSNQIEIDLLSNRSLPEGSSEDPRPPRAGDVIYITYVAVKEHYIRQNINATWQVFDFGSQLECISLLLGFKVQNYRFYEWELKSDGGLPKKLGSWRIVESFNSRVNHTAAIGSPGSSVLGDLAIGNSGPGVQSSPYVPGQVTLLELQELLKNRNSMPQVQVNHTSFKGSIFYHENAGSGTNKNAYINSEWFKRREFSSYIQEGETITHVLFNVHPRALKKRDLDKWGIERFLAVEIEEDIKLGKISYFPFMDDPDVDNPTNGTKEYLSLNNLKFSPVQPLSRFSSGNFEAVCGSLGTFYSTPADGINSFHRFNSNLITEKFEKDTRVLVERNFPQATPLGPKIIAIAGASTSGGALSCITDPSHAYSISVHINSDNFIIFNRFRNNSILNSLRQLSFRPDLDPAPVIDNNDPRPEQFEPILGCSGNLGDSTGVQPGRIVSASDFAALSSFIFKTTNISKIKAKMPDLLDDQIQLISFTKDTDLIVTVGNGYYGRIDIDYELSSENLADDQEILVRMESGGTIEGTVDGRYILPTKSGLMRIDLRWMKADTIRIIGLRIPNVKINDITVTSLNIDKSTDFLEDQSSHTFSDKEGGLNNKITTRPLFFSTDIVSASEDNNSNVFIYFNDTDGGISAVSSNNFGDSWYYYYGIIEKINDSECQNPFCITDFKENSVYIFFQLMNKLLCKKVSYDLFLLEDANLIERFIKDRFVNSDGSNYSTEKVSLYSDKGKILRRDALSYVVAGDMTDKEFLTLLGHDAETMALDPFENRIIEIRNGDGSISSGVGKVRRQPVSRGPQTAVTNRDLDSVFFSGYKNSHGSINLFFLGPVVSDRNSITGSGGGGVQLQCHFSNNDGKNWYDLWEFIAFGYNRLRYDHGFPFIDRSIDGQSNAEIEGTNPNESQQDFLFGINIHWSRMKKHKIEGAVSSQSESQIIDVESPYVFYQSTTKKVYLFYIYQNCLLCKIFDENIFSNASLSRRISVENSIAGVSAVKQSIEQSCRSYFVDGFLDQPELYPEIHDFYNKDTNERMADGNIIFSYSFVINKFNQTRSISAQRICANELPNGHIRVFYKMSSGIEIRSAIWNNKEFWPEDFLKDKMKVDEFQFPEFIPGTPVTGGFGPDKF